jgi:hypothetical protein
MTLKRFVIPNPSDPFFFCHPDEQREGSRPCHVAKGRGTSFVRDLGQTEPCSAINAVLLQAARGSI